MVARKGERETQSRIERASLFNLSIERRATTRPKRRTMKTYCALGFGNNFFYPLGEDSLPVPSDLLPPDGDVSDVDGEEEEDLGIHDRDDGTTDGILVSLLPLNPDVVVVDDDVENVESEDGDGDDRRPPRGGGGRASSASASASDWLRSRRQRRDSARHFASGTIAPPTYSCGATHTSVILPVARGGRSNATTAAASSVVPSPSSGGGAAVGGDVLLVGTIFGRAHRTLTPMPTRLPLRVVRISSGRRHVLALTEGPGGGGGGVVMSWGAGHFGQLGHGPDVTSCPAPRAIERLLPHASGGTVVEIAAGGLHSAAIVALSSSSSSSSSRNQYGWSASSNNGNNGATTIVVRETRTFAWGSNRKGQCGVEGGKCATVPEPLPVVAVKRGEMTSAGGGGVGPTTANGDAAHSNPVDRVVHFEKLSLGRLHTVALTAYGEVFTWGSTSMGRCGHNNGSSLDPPPSSSGPSGGAGRGSGGGGDRRFVQQPRHVSALRNVAIESVAAGGAHTLALSKGGRVFAWGAGGDGQCGQGHAGNLFSPRAVLGLAFGPSEREEGASSTRTSSNDGKAAVLAEEGASSSPSSSVVVGSDPPKSDRVVSVRASGCYSAAITANGDVYTWGYGSGSTIGHPIPSGGASSRLPLIPIIEGNQYSTATAAKVFPEGGSEDDKIRDCRCFDTDLNVMLPRRVGCTRALGLFVEDASLGPGHMIMLCSLRDDPDDDGAPMYENADAGESMRGGGGDGERENQQDSETNVDANDKGEASKQLSSCASGLAQGLRASNDASHLCAIVNKESGDDGPFTASDIIDGPKSGQNSRRSSGSWMTKIKSSRTVKKDSSTPPLPTTLESEKKKSFIQLGKFFRP
jgi:alpha-tubulin suppressor-like RCC1 family protein